MIFFFKPELHHCDFQPKFAQQTSLFSAKVLFGNYMIRYYLFTYHRLIVRGSVKSIIRNSLFCSIISAVSMNLCSALVEVGGYISGSYWWCYIYVAFRYKPTRARGWAKGGQGGIKQLRRHVFLYIKRSKLKE